MREVEEVLGLHTVPFTWPIGDGDRFQGVYVRSNASVLRFEKTAENATKAPVRVAGIEDPELASMLGAEAYEKLHGEIELLDGAGEEYTRERFLSGEQTPVFFGSALTSFGVEPFLRDFRDLCPPPGQRIAGGVEVEPGDDRFSAFIFKVQANMDPSHRDRIAFARICSGKFEGGMRVWHYRLGKEIRLNRAEQFFAQERETIMEAYAGDIVGLYDPGLFRIGDTLSTGGPLTFDAVPRFSPEYFGRVVLLDPMKRKQLLKGIHELAEEGTVQLFYEPGREKDPICGVVGQLQFEILAYRLEHEYGAKVKLDRLGFSHARWVEGVTAPKDLTLGRVPGAVTDQDGRVVALFRDEWEVHRAMRDHDGWVFHETAPIGATVVAEG
jgi:peptide chain release factor 3